MHSETASTDRPSRARLAVGAALTVSIGCAVVATWVDAGTTYRGDEVVTALVISVTAVVGAVVALSVPDNRIGWLVLALATTEGLGEALTEAGVHGELTDPGSVPGAAWLVTTGVLFRTMSAMVGAAAIPAFYPDGLLAGRRWRWLGVLLGVAGALIVASSLLAPVETRLGDHWDGPLAPLSLPTGISDALGLLTAFAVVLAAVGALTGLVARWRRGDLLVRQQLLLFGCAVLVDVLFLCGVAVYVTATPGAPGRWLFAVLGLPVPIAIAMATLNHGLFDLRRAANRALLWLLVTAATMSLYVVVVVIATLLAPDRSAVWPPALAATMAAAALIPFRDRLQHVVARVVYGRWQEPYDVLTGIGARLEAAADTDRLLSEAVDVLCEELDLDGLAIHDNLGHVVAGSRSDGSVRLRLNAYGGTVGSLDYAVSRDLSESELRLIRDLARQLGHAMHARTLLGDLQRTREKLVLTREEERRRLRRDLHDGIGPALAGLTLKAETARSLLPAHSDRAAAHLDALSEEIRATVQDVRRVVEGLRPPALDELGLTGACAQAVSRLANGSGVRGRVEADALPLLPAAVEVAAFRIVQEAATNVIRHARATSMAVLLRADSDNVVVTVTDDGVGLGNGAAGNGLSTMHERADELGGSLRVRSSAGGVSVEACLPYTSLVVSSENAPSP